MKRALALFVAASALSANAVAGPSLIASIYAPDVELGAAEASPDGLTIDLRVPVGSNFWVGGTLASTLSEDTVAPGLGVELGASLSFNVGVQAELAHHIYAYGYLGYGAAKVLADAPLGDFDGKSVTWGAGVQFQAGDHFLIDAGYASLFDGDMEDDVGVSVDTSIAGPRVGLGVKF